MAPGSVFIATVHVLNCLLNVLCTRCNQPKKEQDMPMIGFNPERNPNKGTCRDCLNKTGIN